MPSFLTPYLFWIKLAAIAVLMAGSAFASGYIVHNIDTVKLQKVELARSQERAANVSASLSQLQSFISNMQTADNGYDAELQVLDQDFANLQKALTNATKLKPLPIDCRPDAGRLSVLTSAISAANKAAAVGK